MTMNRRQFLKRTAYYGIGAGTLSQVIQTFSVTNALAQGLTPGYRALVCIFMGGGNDGNNMVVPIGAGPYGSYTVYNNLRGPQGLALPQPGTGAVNDLLSLKSGANIQVNAGATLSSFAFHPGLTGLRNLFDQNKLAVVANVGPLRVPFGNATQTPRQQYLGAPSQNKPYQLFSHSDQVEQFQSAQGPFFGRRSTGWGGLTADKIDPGSTALPQVTTIAGKQLFTVGFTTAPLSIGTGALNTVLVLNNLTGAEASRKTAMDFLRTIDKNNHLVRATSDIMDQAVGVSGAFGNANFQPVTTIFPNNGLGNQLRQVANVIKRNITFGNVAGDPSGLTPLNRQIFFVNFGGFDTHSDELTGQGGAINTSGQLVRGLMGQLSDGMNAFYTAMQELNSLSTGISSRVTAFTMSDFARTYNPAGSGAVVGTDHGWGNYHFVLGDGVIGGRFYGIPFSGSGGTGTIIPNLNYNGGGLNNAYDSQSRGLFIPTTPIESMAWTLSQWYGLQTADKNYVFPLLDGRFAIENLGFTRTCGTRCNPSFLRTEERSPPPCSAG